MFSPPRFLRAFVLTLAPIEFSAPDLVAAPAGPPVERSLLLMPGAGNPRNSEGDFVQLKDGRILFIYSHFYEGRGGDHDPAVLMARYSADGGRTWTHDDARVIGNEGGQNVMSVSLLRLQGQRIALSYSRKNSITDNRRVVRFSRDEGVTWSDAVEIIPASEPGYYSANNDRLVQLRAGRLILPVVQHNGPAVGSEKWSETGLVCAYLSDDAGQTWRRSKGSFYVDNPKGERIVAQEPGVVQLKDGSLLMFLRTNGGFQYFTWSRDGGETWSKAVPSTLRSPLSPASIARIPTTGDLLCVWNDNYDPQAPGVTAGARTPFNCAISRDEGKTWTLEKTLEDDPRGVYCYTAIEFVGDHVLLAHCAGVKPKTTGLGVTQIMRLPVSWLYATP